MTKTTLRQADREAIRDALIAHKFGPIDAELLALENALAEEVRAFVHGDYIKTLERAPKGAFRTTNNIRVSIDGQQHALAFGGRYPNAVYKRQFYEFPSAYTSADPLMARVLEWAGRDARAKKEREALTATALATLGAFRTFDALLESWPDAEKFITAQWRSRAGRTDRQLPVALGKLSEALDLPPETQAESVAA